MPAVARTSAGNSHNREGGGWVYPFHPFLFALASVLHPLSSTSTRHLARRGEGPRGRDWPSPLLVYLGVGALRRAVRRRDRGDRQHLGGRRALTTSTSSASLNHLLDGGYTMVRTLPVALADPWRALPSSRCVSVAAARRAHAAERDGAGVSSRCRRGRPASYEWRNGAARAANDADRAAAEMPEIAEV